MGETTHAPLAPDRCGLSGLWMRGRPAATRSSDSRSCSATQPLSTAARSPDGIRATAAARNSGLGTRTLALGRSPICVGWRSLRGTSDRTALGTTALDVGRPQLGMDWRPLGVAAGVSSDAPLDGIALRWKLRRRCGGRRRCNATRRGVLANGSVVDGDELRPVRRVAGRNPRRPRLWIVRRGPGDRCDSGGLRRLQHLLRWRH